MRLLNGHKEIARTVDRRRCGRECEGLSVGQDTTRMGHGPYKRNETADLLRKHGGKTGKELKAEGK